MDQSNAFFAVQRNNKHNSQQVFKAQKTYINAVNFFDQEMGVLLALPAYNFFFNGNISF
jgi:hypothetical protein